MFTPGVDGPNPARKFSGNNTGEVFVECEVELNVPQRPEPEEPEAANLAAESAAEEGADEAGDGATAAASDETATGSGRKPKATPVAAEASLEEAGPPPTSGQPEMAQKKFRARAHLTVTVPLYVRWTKLEWKEEQ